MGDASSWKGQHDLSVAVRQDGAVLLGLQLYNSVFLFTVQGGRLLLQGSKSMGARAVGFGKTVSFTNTGAAQLLYNAYSADYSTVTAASTVQLYDVPAASTLNASSWSDAYPLPQYLYPNPTQPLASVLTSSTFTAALSTPSTLLVLDPAGSLLFVQPAPPGYYQPTVSGFDPQLPCPAGTYNNDTSYQACELCPAGSYRSGDMSGARCVLCAADAFCPLGSVGAVNASMLEGVSQSFVYPSSPESTLFDDVIFQNIFFLHGGAHCVSVSPVFWGLIVLAVLLLVLGCMFRLRYCVNDAKSRKIRRLTKFIFKRTDLVKEGEHWIGGLMSLVLLVFVVTGVWFAAEFIAQYPIESAPNPGFACQTTYNAKFSSSMQSVALPADEVAGPMYALLGAQQLALVVDVLNTNISCDDASAAIVTSVTTALPFSCASSAAATITLTTRLPQLSSTVQFTLKGPQLIGGLRLSFQANGSDSADDASGNEYALRPLLSSQSLSVAKETLQKSVQLPVSLTRVINTTDPLSSGGSVSVSGLWLPVFPAASDAMFMSTQAYLASAASPFTLTVATSETPFWVYNQQTPISRSAEAAFKTLLYIIMLLEVFGLAFLLFKLMKPLIVCIALKGKGRSVKKVWDRPDSSDEENWLEDLLYGDRVRPLGTARGGVREWTEAEKNERARARAERREARDGKASAREDGGSHEPHHGYAHGHSTHDDSGDQHVRMEEQPNPSEVQLTPPHVVITDNVDAVESSEAERMEATDV